MKTLKVICLELVLAIFLSVSAQAGDISTPGVTATPIPTPGTEMSDSYCATDSGFSTSDYLDSADLIQLFVEMIF